MSSIRSIFDVIPSGAHGVYACLSQLPAGLCLDVGAASGATVAAILKASPNSRVIAFEPFPGNFIYIEQRHASDARVRIVKKAVSNSSRPMRFHVPSVVQKGHGKWRDMVGYSSVGHLVSQKDPRAQNSIEVQTTCIDDEVSDPVNFMKIDVQGHEFFVLEGASRTFERGVNFMLVEFNGDERVIKFLAERNYVIFDCSYMSTAKPSIFRSSWNILRTSKLSTGVESPVMVPSSRPSSPLEYAHWFSGERARSKSLWTDLLCVAPNFLAKFESSVRQI